MKFKLIDGAPQVFGAAMYLMSFTGAQAQVYQRIAPSQPAAQSTPGLNGPAAPVL